MKINPVTTAISIALALLIAYAFRIFNCHENKIILTIISFVFSAITIIGTIGVSFSSSRITVNIRVLSVIFFIIGISSITIILFFSFLIPLLIITLGVQLLLYILFVYLISKSNQ